MRDTVVVALSVILALLLGGLISGGGRGPSLPMGKETAYDRVMRTGTLRCGYFSWPPYMSKNLKTGAFEGFFYDYVEAMARHMGIKVDWAAEVLYGNVVQEIQSGRIDAFCAGMWPTSSLSKYLDFSIPINFNGVYAIVRADDTRFDGDLKRIDDAKVRIAAMEGSIGGVIARARFPKATLAETSMVAGSSTPFMDLITRKADVVFTDLLILKTFADQNPGKLKRVEAVSPVNVWGNGVAFGKHEEALVSAVNVATQEMLYGGEIDAIMKANHLGPDIIYPVALPYRAP